MKRLAIFAGIMEMIGEDMGDAVGSENSGKSLLRARKFG
jgi:hypothetical protein